MGIKTGDPIGIFTGGWFSLYNQFGAIDVETGGWYENFDDMLVQLDPINIFANLNTPYLIGRALINLNTTESVGLNLTSDATVEGYAIIPVDALTNVLSVNNASGVGTASVITNAPASASFHFPLPHVFFEIAIRPQPVNLNFNFNNIQIVGYGNISATDTLGISLSQFPIENIQGTANIVSPLVSAVLITTSASVIIDNGIIRNVSGIPIYFVVSDRENVLTTMFGDFAGNLYSMGNRTNMPNNWITKCRGYTNERKLFDKVISESIKQHGVCLDYYITTYDTNYDRIWGEDNDRRFVRKFQFNGFYTLPREDKMFTKFGIQGMDTFSIFVSKLHFSGASMYDYNRSVRIYPDYIPKVGDILMADYNKFIYEITEVKEEVGMFLLSKQHVWELVVRPYKDEHLNFSATTSATMPELSAFVDRSTDSYDLKTIINEKKVDVKYAEKSLEKSSQDPFAGW